MGYFFIGLMIALTLYGQFAIKLQVSMAGPLPAALADQARDVLGLCRHGSSADWLLGSWLPCVGCSR